MVIDQVGELELLPVPRWRHRRPRARVAPVLAACLLTGLAVAGWLRAFDHVPLLNPWASAAFETLGGGLLVSSWLRPGRRWRRRTLPVLLVAVAVTVGAIALLLRVTGTVTDAYPPSFAVWVFAGFTAVAGLPFTMRGVVDGSARWRRAAAIAAVPLTLAGGFMLIDQQYGIWPTVGDVLAHNGVIGTDQATAMLNNPNARPAAATAGVTVALDAPATRSHFHHRPGMVFLPPAYFGPDGAKLPVLVMLVGAPGTPVNWLTSGGGRPADNAIAAAHHGVAPVLVIVDHNGSATGDTECVDGPQGNAETYLTQDVPAFISGTLHIQHDAGRWGIVGFSEGGTCSLDLVLGHPGIYQHLVDLGGDAKPNLGNPQHTLMALYGGSTAAERAHDPSLLLAARRFPGVTAWFGAGADDPAKIVVAQHMTAAATRDGIPAATYVGVGGHNWQFAADAFAHILPRLCTQLGMAEYDPPH